MTTTTEKELKKIAKKLEKEINDLDLKVTQKIGSDETYWRNVGLLIAKVDIYEKISKLIN